MTDSGLFDQDAFTVIADAGGEGGVIVDSVLAAMQGAIYRAFLMSAG